MIDHWLKDCVFVNGCFDVLHIGHVSTLEFARRVANELNQPMIVAINSDESIRRLKGSNRPINNLADRMAMLRALKCVDLVLYFEEDSPVKLIQKLQPGIIIKGADYTPEQVVGREYVPKIMLAPYLEGHSTTEIIKRNDT